MLLLFVGFIPFYNLADSNISPSGSRPLGMGNAFISQFDISAAYHNQAGLAKIDSYSVSLLYENRFLLKEISFRGILIVIPTKTVNFAFHYSVFGPTKWMESNISVACSKQLSSMLSAGIQINYFGIKLPEDGTTISSCGAELGFIYQPSNNLFFGIHLANPFSIPFITYSCNEKIVYRFRVGFHYLLSKEVQISIEAEKNKNITPLLKFGVEWEAVKNFYYRVGYNSGSTKLFAGLGFQYRQLKTDYAFSYNQYLGFTPSLSITLNLK